MCVVIQRKEVAEGGVVRGGRGGVAGGNSLDLIAVTRLPFPLKVQAGEKEREREN